MKTSSYVIIGGGVSGALTAYHLSRRSQRAQILLIEPRPEAGLGLAYSTPSLRHLLNVPAGKISALPEQPHHFLHWVQRHHDPAITESDFAPRAVFGRYIQSLLAKTPDVKHLQATAVDCRLDGGQGVVTLMDGRRVAGRAVVLATGNFDPARLPGVADEVVRSRAYCHSAWNEETYRGLDEDAEVVLIGTGLTAVDVILRLRERGHRGGITAISRHGVFPSRHARCAPLAQCVIAGEPPARARELLRAVHDAIRAGRPWRAVIDSLRARTNEFWLALPPDEQRRFRRHLQRRWEVVRHRMAPPIAKAIDAELREGAVLIRQGSLEGVTPEGDGARVRARSRAGAVFEVTAARVINCTGPDLNYRRVGSALLNSLFAQGLISAGPLGGGLWSDADGALRAADGSVSEVLFTLGPARQGTLLESIAIPELRVQAVALAALLAQREHRAVTRHQAGVRAVSGGMLVRMPEVAERGA
ncbi:MAG: FAD-dependent oxidoreductase [Acidobacteriaceae bacterium]